jgi:hypothetical protein
MSVDVTTGRGATVTEVKVRGKTKVHSMRVGRPIKNIQTASGDINNLIGINTRDKEDGSVLVYNGDTQNFEATKNLENQFINGGNF